jgi:hypothetical protein
LLTAKRQILCAASAPTLFNSSRNNLIGFAAIADWVSGSKLNRSFYGLIRPKDKNKIDFELLKFINNDKKYRFRIKLSFADKEKHR